MKPHRIFPLLLLSIILWSVGIDAAPQYSDYTDFTYNELWNAYQQHIADIAQQRKQRDTDFYQHEVIPHFQKQTAALDGRETQVLEALRERARNHKGKLDFDGEVPERGAFVCTSDVSPRIFTALLKDGLVTPDRVVSMLDYSPMLMTPGWRDLVKQIRTETPEDRLLWTHATILLYQSGADRALYRPVLSRFAEGGNSVSLVSLLYDHDKESGLQKVVDSPENRTLVKQLCIDTQSPVIKAICAAYFAEIGEIAQSEQICLEVLQIPYQVQTRQEDAFPLPKADDVLYMARHGCGLGAVEITGVHSTLFYLVRTERAFKRIDECANMQVPVNAMSFIKWDVDDAQSDLREILPFLVRDKG